MPQNYLFIPTNYRLQMTGNGKCVLTLVLFLCHVDIKHRSQDFRLGGAVL